MTVSTPKQSTDHMIQICRERSARGVATRADWERLHEINPDRAKRELQSFLALEQTNPQANPFQKSPRRGMVIGFIGGVAFMSVWWLIGAFLQARVVQTGFQWNMVTLSQYAAATLIPAFAWLGWRFDQKKQSEVSARIPGETLRNASWEDLLSRFDSTRKAGGTRMY